MTIHWGPSAWGHSPARHLEDSKGKLRLPFTACASPVLSPNTWQVCNTPSQGTHLPSHLEDGCPHRLHFCLAMRPQTITSDVGEIINPLKPLTGGYCCLDPRLLLCLPTHLWHSGSGAETCSSQFPPGDIALTHQLLSFETRYYLGGEGQE